MTREEAIKKVKAWDFLDNDEKEVLETLIPEFQGSKEEWIEKIRTEIISYLKNRSILSVPEHDAATTWLSWIEKQGEHVEPDFKVGDWVVCGKTIAQISDIQGQYYIGIDIYGNDLTLRFDKIHLWTIQDAEDGDVLVSYDIRDNMEWLFLYRQNPHKLRINDPRFYCHYNIKSDSFKKDADYVSLALGTKFRPATKEQRDTFFAKMKEADYEWNTKKKELRKIEKEGRDKEITNFNVLPGLYKCIHRMFDGTSDGKLLFEVGNIYKCISKHDRAEFEISYGHSIYLEDPVVCKHFIPFEKQGKQKSKWCDDDEQYLLVCKNALYKYQMSDKWDADLISKWLDDKLRNGKQVEHKSGWTDEDEKNLLGIIDEIKANKSDAPDYDLETYDRFLSWLGSLKQKIREQ